MQKNLFFLFAVFLLDTSIYYVICFEGRCKVRYQL